MSQVHDGRARFAADRRIVGRIWLLFLLVLVFSALRGAGVGSDVRSVWVEAAGLVWPVTLLVGAMAVVRLGRVLLLGIPIAELSQDRIVLRFEPIRLRDRVIERASVSRVRVGGSRFGEAIEVFDASGRRVLVNLKLLDRPDDLIKAIRDTWPDVALST